MDTTIPLVRVGVAIGIPEPWGAELDRHRIASGDVMGPFIPAHLTLLGPTDVPEANLGAIEEHLAGVADRHPAFDVQLRGTGTFRPVTEVVFVAVAAGISRLEQLAAAVREGPLFRQLHYPYHPHVTVAHDAPAEGLDRVYEKLAGFEATFPVDHFTLYVHGSGLRWRPVRDFPLATEGGVADG